MCFFVTFNEDVYAVSAKYIQFITITTMIAIMPSFDIIGPLFDSLFCILFVYGMCLCLNTTEWLSCVKNKIKAGLFAPP
jgi:hypothetical protein